MSNRSLRRLALLSMAAAVVTTALKAVAWYLTGSVGLLSDAAESTVNFAAATVAWIALWYASRPVDLDHNYGHEKIEYFSSGLEGGLILVAGLGAFGMALDRFFSMKELSSLNLGLTLSLVAALINFVIARILMVKAKGDGSIVLEADAHHLMTDVITSVGVVAGLALQWMTGSLWVDPLLAMLVALLILRTGYQLLYRSFQGLMDQSLPEADLEKIRGAILRMLFDGMEFHALRTRQAGSRRFVDFHLLVPGDMSVEKAHELGEEIVAAVIAAIGAAEVSFHLEPIEQPDCWNDSELIPLEKGKAGA